MASLHFYKYYLRYNGTVTNYNMADLIDNIWLRHNSHQRTISIGNHWYSMSAYWRPEENDETVRYFWIDKSLNNNPWTGNLGTDNRVPVPGTLYQNASCVLIPGSHSLVIYEPQGSPSPNELSRYLERFIQPTLEEDSLDVVLRPVTSNLTFNQITRNYEIKSIDLEVNPDTFEPDLAFPNYNADPVSTGIIGGLMAMSNATRNGSDGNDTPTVSVKIKKRARKDPINFMLMAYLQGNGGREGTGIIDIDVTVRRPGQNKDDHIKLARDCNLLQAYNLPAGVTGHEAIFRDLDEKFHKDEFPELALRITGLPPLEEFEEACIEYVANPEGMLTERDLNENEQFGDAG